MSSTSDATVTIPLRDYQEALDRLTAVVNRLSTIDRTYSSPALKKAVVEARSATIAAIGMLVDA